MDESLLQNVTEIVNVWSGAVCKLAVEEAERLGITTLATSIHSSAC
jgi:hypothetical protein